MSQLTVGMLRHHALPEGTRLLGGADGLNHRVSWSATLRTRAPAFQSLKGGEFLLISTASLHALDPSLTPRRVLQGVEAVGVAGAAIVGEVGADCVAFANEHDFPLFALPDGTSVTDVEAAISRAVAEARSEIHRRAHEIYAQLTQLGIEGRSLSAIGDELQRVVGMTASLLDGPPTPAVLSALLPREVASPGLVGLTTEIRAWLNRVPVAPAHAPVEFFSVSDLVGLLIAPLTSRGQLTGCVALTVRKEDLDDLHREAVRGAAAAAAIVIARAEAVLDAEERAQSDVLAEVVAGASPPTEGLRRRASRLGVDLGAASVVIVSDFSVPAERPGLVESYLRDVEASVPGPIGGFVDGRMVLICPRDCELRREVLEGLRQQLGRRVADADVSTGVGRPRTGLDGLRRSYREALNALVVGQRVFGAGRVVSYASLGLYRLLLDIEEKSDLEGFYQEVLGSLIAADGRGGGELVRTLEAFFASNGSPTEASARLHIHRNTLLYRLQRIQAITKLDLNDSEVRLTIQVGLKIHQVRRLISAAGREYPDETPAAGLPRGRSGAPRLARPSPDLAHHSVAVSHPVTPRR